MTTSAGDDVEQWLWRVEAAPLDQLPQLLNAAPLGTEPWVWELVLEMLRGRVSPQIEYWLLYRAFGRRGPVMRSTLDVCLDFDALMLVFDAARTDEERFFVLDDAIWCSELLDGENGAQVAQWLTSRTFVSRVWRARYIHAILAQGRWGTEIFCINQPDIEVYAEAMLKHLRAVHRSTLKPPDFRALGLPGGLLTQRAIVERREDVIHRVKAAVGDVKWRQIWQFYMDGSSNCRV